MTDKILITLYGNDVAPRFDLATEILMTDLRDGKESERIIVLPQASAEKLCHLIITEGIDVVICSGIEEEYYHYLVWKKIKVFDSVVGPWQSVIESFRNNNLTAGAIIT